MDIKDGKFRHELKYLCPTAQQYVLQSRIGGLLLPDKHADQNGCYNIRSLYFDDCDNSCYFDNQSGAPVKEKFRLRIYGASSNRINLEIKRNIYSKTQKLSCVVTPEQCRALIDGTELDERSCHPVLRQLLLKRKTHLLHPVVIVSYDRTPYVYSDGNVRVTFDNNICASGEIGGFLNESIPLTPVMPVGVDILEVKYDEFIPDFIAHTLEVNRLPRTAFSKYYYCRKALMGGTISL